MSLLRRCRVNAALTIQLFSQLFHFVNMWLFNRLVTDPESGLCSYYWGAIIRQQLGHVEAWAEKQGLELAADCHLSRIVQVGCPGSHLPAVGGLNVVSASPLAGVRTWIQQNGCLMGTGKAAVVRWFARCFSDTHVSQFRRPEVQGQVWAGWFSAFVSSGVLPVGMSVFKFPVFTRIPVMLN